MFIDVYFEKESFGITKESLRVLRDAIAVNLDNEIAVVQVPTDEICCAYFIFNHDQKEVIFTGDGFRTDEGGEGGAGQRTANVLFSIFGIIPTCVTEITDLSEIYSDDDEKIFNFLLKISNDIAKDLLDSDYKKPRDRAPQYIRYAKI